MDALLDEHLQRFVVDQDHAALSDLVEAARPLVLSVCCRQVRDHALAEDAAQETLIKLVRQAETIRGNVAAWLATTARRTCLDRLRRQASHDRAVRGLAEQAPAEHDGVLSWEAALRHLDRALAELDPATQALVRARFMEGQKLRELADDRQASIAKMSRDVAGALQSLAEVFRDMGFEQADDARLHGMLHDDRGLAFGLRDAARRVSPASSTPCPAPAGWNRPIRVGVLLTYTTASIPNLGGWRMPMAGQAAGLDLAMDPRFDFVALVEPDTSHHGIVERHVRDLDLTAGVLDASSVAALKTLDVIWYGRQWALDRRIASAVRAAVESGVGLFSEGEKALSFDDRDVQTLLLAAAPLHMCCTGHSHGQHHLPLPATVHRAHPGLPGLRQGQTYLTDGCAMLVELVPGAEALMTFDGHRPPTCNCIPCRSGQNPPVAGRPTVAAAGSIGRGRVVVFYINHIAQLLASGGQHDIRDLLIHLAEPRKPG